MDWFRFEFKVFSTPSLYFLWFSILSRIILLLCLLKLCHNWKFTTPYFPNLLLFKKFLKFGVKFWLLGLVWISFIFLLLLVLPLFISFMVLRHKTVRLLKATNLMWIKQNEYKTLNSTWDQSQQSNYHIKFYKNYMNGSCSHINASRMQSETYFVLWYSNFILSTYMLYLFTTLNAFRPSEWFLTTWRYNVKVVNFNTYQRL